MKIDKKLKKKGKKIYTSSRKKGYSKRKSERNMVKFYKIKTQKRKIVIGLSIMLMLMMYSLMLSPVNALVVNPNIGVISIVAPISQSFNSSNYYVQGQTLSFSVYSTLNNSYHYSWYFTGTDKSYNGTDIGIYLNNIGYFNLTLTAFSSLKVLTTSTYINSSYNVSYQFYVISYIDSLLIAYEPLLITLILIVSIGFVIWVVRR